MIEKTFHLVGDTIYFGGDYVGTLDPKAAVGPREEAREVLQDYHPGAAEESATEARQVALDEVEAERKAIVAEHEAEVECFLDDVDLWKGRCNDLETELRKLEGERDDLQAQIHNIKRARHPFSET